MKKTALILSTLEAQQKRISYYACDVDRSALRRCIRDLQTLFPSATSSIKIQGLHGTYEDCAAWLQTPLNRRLSCSLNNPHRAATSPTTLLWLGNSMANFPPSEASNYIKSFLRSGSRMIIGLDGSTDHSEIRASYEGPANRSFVLNGLSHANDLLGSPAFKIADWEFKGEWNERLWMHEAFYVAKNDLEVEVEGNRYRFGEGERVRSIRSGKWPVPKVKEICEEAGGRVKEVWGNEEGSYGVYLVEGGGE